MNRKKLLLFCVLLVFICFASTAFAWQGRMSGMDQPTGLISDESDFLIHPSKIADGSGSNYYLDYKFNYIRATKWNNTFNYNPAIFSSQFPYQARGSERDHDASLGGTWAFGPGRIGLFFHYLNADGTFKGTDNFGPIAIEQETFSLDKDSTAFDIKLLYGLPVGAWKLGTELAFGHKTLKNEITETLGDVLTITNNPVGGNFIFPYTGSVFPYGVPVDLNWNEASFKLSAETAAGPGILTFTPKISTIFHGRSKFSSNERVGSLTIADLEGSDSINGWATGADLWYRVRLNETTSLPFIVSTNYNRRRADIGATETISGSPVDIATEAREFIFTAGGGIDNNISKQTKIAAGLYYTYIQSKTIFTYSQGPLMVANNQTPDENENRISAKLAAEHIFTPEITARMGVNVHYGWVRDRYDLAASIGTDLSQELSTSGHRYGIDGGVGATVKIAKLAIEPFVTAGLQKTNLDNGSGSFAITSIPISTVSLHTEKNEWSIGGGVSVKY